MADCNHTDQNDNHQKLAMENCCADQVIQSMFEHVAGQDQDRFKNRSDRKEIAKLSNTLVENEFIFGSPNETVLESVQQKILEGERKKTESDHV